MSYFILSHSTLFNWIGLYPVHLIGLPLTWKARRQRDFSARRVEPGVRAPDFVPQTNHNVFPAQDPDSLS